MFAKQLICETIPPLRKDETGQKALLWMRELGVRQLPVVDDKKLLNIISEDDIINSGDMKQKLAEYKKAYRNPFVYEYAHLIEVVRISYTLKISIIPVLDEDENYLGVITADSLLRALCHFSSWQEEGSIIEIEMPSRNYSLYEIARLVEGNNLKILSSFTHLRPETQTTVVTLKINSLNLESIVSAFERYGISVNGVYHETEYSEDLRERYDSLMRYLNV